MLGDTRYPSRARAEPSRSNLSVWVTEMGSPPALRPAAELEPLMSLPERSTSSPPTIDPACQFAPAWKPPTNPAELGPFKNVWGPCNGAIDAGSQGVARLVTGSRPQPYPPCPPM